MIKTTAPPKKYKNYLMNVAIYLWEMSYLPITAAEDQVVQIGAQNWICDDHHFGTRFYNCQQWKDVWVLYAPIYIVGMKLSIPLLVHQEQFISQVRLSEVHAN